jgi:hypothetical protein
MLPGLKWNVPGSFSPFVIAHENSFTPRRITVVEAVRSEGGASNDAPNRRLEFYFFQSAQHESDDCGHAQGSHGLLFHGLLDIRLEITDCLLGLLTVLALWATSFTLSVAVSAISRRRSLPESALPFE